MYRVLNKKIAKPSIQTPAGLGQDLKHSTHNACEKCFQVNRNLCEHKTCPWFVRIRLIVQNLSPFCKNRARGCCVGNQAMSFVRIREVGRGIMLSKSKAKRRNHAREVGRYLLLWHDVFQHERDITKNDCGSGEGDN